MKAALVTRFWAAACIICTLFAGVSFGAPGSPAVTMKIIIDGRVLSGPQSTAVVNADRASLPIATIAKVVGSTISIDSTARAVNVRRANGVIATFDSAVGQVLENGTASLTIPNSRSIAISPSVDDLTLPAEIVAALLSVSIRIDEKQNAVIVSTGGGAVAGGSSTLSGGSFFDIYRIDGEYNLTRYSTAASADAVLTSVGRIGDGRFYLHANTAGPLSSPHFVIGELNVTRPNGQIFDGGDIHTGSRAEFLYTMLRGGLVSVPLNSWTVTAFGGKAASGRMPLIQLDPLVPQRRLRFDTTVFGAYVTRSVTRFLTVSGGGMRFAGTGGGGTLGAGSAIYDDNKLRFTIDTAAGTFSKGTAVAFDASGTYAATESLSFQGRYAHIGRNFLSPQIAGHEPIDLKAAGVTWSPRRWINTSVTASTARRPGQGSDSFVTAALGMVPGDGRSRFYLSHTESRSPLVKKGEFTLLTARTQFRKIEFFANATRVKTIGNANYTMQFGADRRIDERDRIEVSQGFGSHGLVNGQLDWHSTRFAKQGLSFAAGIGYTRSSTTPLRLDERLTASLRLWRDGSVDVNYLRSGKSTSLVLRLKMTLFKKREAASYLGASVVEAARLGTVSGRIFQDVNGNGVYDPGVDKPQAGVTVRLDRSRYAVTDDNGIYTLDAVTAGTHNAALDLTSVRADLTMIDGGARSVEVTGGKTLNADFSLVRTGRIAGRVFIDANGNGRFDEGEQPLSDVRVVTSSGRDTLTDSDGAFSIADLAPGEHVVLIDGKTLPEKLVSAVSNLSVKVFEAKETGGVWLPVVPEKAEVKRFRGVQN